MRPNKYNWDKILGEAGDESILRKGRDFQVKEASFIQMVRNNASLRAIKVSVTRMGNGKLLVINLGDSE